MPSVLIVDDHAPFRRAARALLERAGFEVVGESADAAHALKDAHVLRPAIVLLDVGLPDGDGFDLAPQLAESAMVVMISTREAAWYRRRLATSPARGFIAKGDLSAETLKQCLGSS